MKKNQYENGEGAYDPLIHRVDPRGVVAWQKKQAPQPRKKLEALEELAQSIIALRHAMNSLTFYGPKDEGKPDETQKFENAAVALDNALDKIGDVLVLNRTQMPSLTNVNTPAIVESLKTIELQVCNLLSSQTLGDAPALNPAPPKNAKEPKNAPGQKHAEFKKDTEELAHKIQEVIKLLLCRRRSGGEGARGV